MSNFICCECGIAQIDCGGDCYKTPKEIELEKKLEIATKALEEYTTNESYKLCVVYCHYGEPVHASDVAIQALKEMEGVK